MVIGQLLSVIGITVYCSPASQAKRSELITVYPFTELLFCKLLYHFPVFNNQYSTNNAQLPSNASLEHWILSVGYWLFLNEFLYRSVGSYELGDGSFPFSLFYS
jgi:hypothetical protein